MAPQLENESDEKSFKEELKGLKAVEWLKQHDKKLLLGGAVMLVNQLTGGVPFDMLQGTLDGIEDIFGSIFTPIGEFTGSVVGAVGLGVESAADGDFSNG